MLVLLPLMSSLLFIFNNDFGMGLLLVTFFYEGMLEVLRGGVF